MTLLSAQISPAPGERLRDAALLTAEFLSGIVRADGRRIPAGSSPGRARIERLIASQAWIDASLALVELELPQWKVRRLAHDGGDWHCALSLQRDLPDWLDEPVETHHADLAVAILDAFAEARRISGHGGSVPAARDDINPLWEPVCSENFG